METNELKSKTGWKIKLRAIGVSILLSFFLNEYFKDTADPKCLRSAAKWSYIVICGLQAQVFMGLIGLLAGYLWFLVLRKKE